MVGGKDVGNSMQNIADRAFYSALEKAHVLTEDFFVSTSHQIREASMCGECRNYRDLDIRTCVHARAADAYGGAAVMPPALAGSLVGVDTDIKPVNIRIPTYGHFVVDRSYPVDN